MHDDQIARFWDKYIIKLIHYNLPGHSRRCYVRYVEDYVKVHPDLPLKQHTAQYPTKCLGDLGRKESLQTWTFKHVIDALRILFIGVFHMRKINAGNAKSLDEGVYRKLDPG